MDKCCRVSICILLVQCVAIAATKPHVVALGRWTSISLRNEDSGNQATAIKVRPLYVDGRAKEFTIGPAPRHDRTHFRSAANLSHEQFPAPAARSHAMAMAARRMVARRSGERQSSTVIAPGIRSRFFHRKLVSRLCRLLRDLRRRPETFRCDLPNRPSQAAY